ncbi:hypothetical protein BGZ57DRAFT_1005149 [Hyaloscypha finlandica]|nr:hypothetical protein F5882DRAFT_471217 [Hyaloscypha sp. PMI_1271]KAH8773947.1 hypothetical protein BGZ57DRAFT_1005149 [Hyaloscypha finlandica]
MASRGSFKSTILGLLGGAPAIASPLELQWARERASIIQDLRPLPVPTPDESTHLHAMRTEVLQCIARYLPTSSEVALTLTCRLILHKLGGQSWQEIHGSTFRDYTRIQQWTSFHAHKPERGMLLILLDRDIKHLINCYCCQILHEPAKTMPAPRRKAKPTDICCTIIQRNRRLDGKKRHFFHVLDDITFSEIQHSMKLHLRFGSGCTDLLRRLSKTSTTLGFGRRGDSAYLQLSTLARVIAGHLVIRSEYYILLPWWKVRDTDQHIYEVFQALNVCPHIQESSYDKAISNLWLCSGHHNNPGNCRFCDIRNNAPNRGVPRFVAAPWLQQCNHCPTEFQIDVTAAGVKGLAIAFTVWQDFRDCTSPHNTIWKGDYLKGNYWDFVEAWRHVDFEVGSIKAGFEQVASSNVSNHLRTLPDMPVKGRGCFLNIE